LLQNATLGNRYLSSTRRRRNDAIHFLAFHAISIVQIVRTGDF
jgi:hypothetical protein